MTIHYILQGDGELKLGPGEVLALTSNALADMPPGLTHAIQFGSVNNETGAEGQGDDSASLCELVAGLLYEVSLTVACGRVQVSYAGGMGLFDHLKEAIVLDFGGSPQMRDIFETLIDDCRQSGPACAAMMTAHMNQCLIHVLRRANQQGDGALPWLSALDDPRHSRMDFRHRSRPDRNTPFNVQLMKAAESGASRLGCARRG